MWFTGALAIIGAAISIIGWALRLFSPTARLHRLELWLERQRTASNVESARQEVENERIDRQPDKTGQDLVDDLNEKFR